MRKTWMMTVTLLLAACGGAVGDSEDGSAAEALSGNPCGAGYALVGHHALNGGSGPVLGYLDVYYSGGAGKNCAVAVANDRTWDKRYYRFASIRVVGSRPSWDDWAGDVSNFHSTPVHSKRSVGQCIDVCGTTDHQLEPGQPHAAQCWYGVNCG